MGLLEPARKRSKLEEDSFFGRVCNDPSIIKVLIRVRKPFHKNGPPKSLLHEHVLKSGLEKLPLYHTEQVDKLFFSTVTVNGKQYANRYL